MFKSIFLNFKWLILLATALSVSAALAGIGMLQLITQQLNLIDQDESALFGTFFIFVLLVSAVLLFGLSSKYLLARLSAQVVYDFRDSLTRRLLCTPYIAIERVGGHRVLTAMKTDASKLSEGLLILPEFVYGLVTLVLCQIYMMYTSWKLFLVVFSLIFVIALIASFFWRYSLTHYNALRKYEDDLFRGFKTLVDGSKELTSNAKRCRFIYKQVLDPNSKNIRRSSIKVEIIFTLLGSLTSTFIFFVIGIIVFGSKSYFADVSVTTVVSFVLVIFYMVGPLVSVVGFLNELSHLQVSHRNIESLELGDAEDFENKIESDHNLPTQFSWKTLKVKHLTFQYHSNNTDDYPFQVGPLNTEFRRGEAVFLTGGNGSGKSTFAKLLVGLYQPDLGGISLDEMGVPTHVSMEQYQHLFSTIFSDFYLFQHVLNDRGELENDDVIAQHLIDLGLDKKITSENGKLSTIALSQGQKKRLALLMSCIENTPICLYDEWAADQDPRFRSIFYNKIIPELKRQNKLVIVITHDDRYFHLADQLIKLENGQIIEDFSSGYNVKEKRRRSPLH